MDWLQKLQLRFYALFRKQKLDAQMDDEMRSHIEMQTQENIDAGMQPAEARYAALRHFGQFSTAGLPAAVKIWHPPNSPYTPRCAPLQCHLDR
jgi:hypothetical protein